MNSPAPRSLTLEAAEELMNAHFPSGFVEKSHRAAQAPPLHIEHGPLDESHLAALNAHLESGADLGVRPVDLKAIRNTHHRLAQLLAMGMDELKAGRLCNFGPSRVSILKNDPAFRELLTHYEGSVKDEFADFVSTAANLSLDFLGKLQQDLDEHPEKFTPTHVMEAIKLLADRTGHAPVQKTHNVNVNIGLGDRLRSARERANAIIIDQSGS